MVSGGHAVFLGIDGDLAVFSSDGKNYRVPARWLSSKPEHEGHGTVALTFLSRQPAGAVDDERDHQYRTLLNELIHPALSEETKKPQELFPVGRNLQSREFLRGRPQE